MEFRFKILVILALAAFYFSPSPAQTVYGKVRDPQGNSIAGARVTLFSKDTVDFRETRSGPGGEFSFPSGVLLERVGASFPGREYKEMDVGTDLGLVFSLGPETEKGRWDIILSSAPEVLGGTNSAVLLSNGKIIYCHNTVDPFLFDPATGTTSPVAPSPKRQGCHSTTLLPDGRVIYVGGHETGVYGPGTRQVKTFNPSANSWTVQPNLGGFRWYPSMVQLPEGELLAAGGGNERNPERSKTSETMDPSTLQWTPSGDIALGNEVSPIVLLYTGEVLMTHRPPQLYNPGTRKWRKAADFQQANRMANGDHTDHDMVLLPDGRAAAIGFMSFTSGNLGSLVEIYDPVKDIWNPGADFAPMRSRPNLTLMPDGKILVMGGYKHEKNAPGDTNAWGQVRLTDAFDAATDSWRRLADMNVAREYHATPILVPDGRVIMVAGEGSPGNEPALSVLEAFTPPNLFRGVRPRLLNLYRTEYARGETVKFDVDRTKVPTRILLMSLSANTHFMESGNSRHLDLPFAKTGSAVEATLPLAAAKLPYGYYMLIAMVDDIPSIARIIRVDKPGSVRILSAKSLRRKPANPEGWNRILEGLDSDGSRYLMTGRRIKAIGNGLKLP